MTEQQTAVGEELEPLRGTGVDAELIALLRLLGTAGLSPRILRRLLSACGSAVRVLEASPGRLGAIRGVGVARASLIRTAPPAEVAARELERLRRAGVEVLTPALPGWPGRLEQLADPPPALFVRGLLAAGSGPPQPWEGSVHGDEAGERARSLLAAASRDAVGADLTGTELTGVELTGTETAAADPSRDDPLHDDPPADDPLADDPLADDPLADDPRRAVCVAIVGARRASAYGVRVARQLGCDLAAAGVSVISGLARGVDTAAHRGALAAGGHTVAILGSGLARLYPPENVGLAREIVASGGAVVSELTIDAPPLRHHFPRRNRVMAALADAVVVVEAGERSGSLITADHALDLGRDVLAVPGRIDAPGSRGTHRLLAQGAALCESAADVLTALGLTNDESPEERERAASAASSARDPAERALLAALEGEERFADDLLEVTGLDVQAGLAALSALELAGVVESTADGRYGMA